jgi:hypothetical protein
MDEGSENLGECRNVSLDICGVFGGVDWKSPRASALVARTNQRPSIKTTPGFQFFDNFPNSNGGLPAEGCLVIQSCPHFAPCSIMDGEDS